MIRSNQAAVRRVLPFRNSYFVIRNSVPWSLFPVPSFFVLCTSYFVLAAAAPALADSTVTLTLLSPQAGQSVSPGATIEWSITASTSPDDNEGLALVICDLRQDNANPQALDIPRAFGVPAGMENFSAPEGINNPADDGAATGYVGVQRGTPGMLNLIQIGGAQSNFGTPAPKGSGSGENAELVPGVGHGDPQTIATGTFTAPDAEGDYTFALHNALANVLTELNAPPDYSIASPATVQFETSSLTFTVGDSVCLADFNGDGDVGPFDLAFLLGSWGPCDGDCPYDLDSDGTVGPFDLALLLGNWGECP